jgi:hypothetical protein
VRNVSVILDPRMVLDGTIKTILYDPSLRDVTVAYRTLNPRRLSSILSGGTIWGYNLTAKVSGF